MDFDFTTETITPDATNILTIAGSGGLEIPIGTTAQRPVVPVDGTIRYNIELLTIEGFSDTQWRSLIDTNLTPTYNWIDFVPQNTAPLQFEGRVYYNNVEKALTVYDDITGTSVQLGYETLVRVKNVTGSTITNGTVVYINGSSGDFPTVAPAIATGDLTSRVIGVVTYDMPTGTEGKITVRGLVNDLDTSAYTAGDYVYLSATTAGTFTATAPLGPANAQVIVGVIVRSHINAGKLLVNTSRSYSGTIYTSLGGEPNLKSENIPVTQLDSGTNASSTTFWRGDGTWSPVVTSLSGTANQVSVSASTGDITVSTPLTFVAPGTLQWISNVGYSTESLTATGTTQGTATLITKTYSVITSGAPASGVILPTPSFSGELHTVSNATGAVLYVWPQSGAAIDDIAINSNLVLNPGHTVNLIWDGSKWQVSKPTIEAGNAGISVTSSGGNYNISNTGVLSFSAGTTGLTPVTATSGAVTLSGILSIGSGGTGQTSALSAFNALSPLTTQGDVLYHNGTNNVRLPVGTNTQVLSVVTGSPSWINQSAINAGTAVTSTNISGGTAGSIFYQTAASTTTTLPIGGTDEILAVSGGLPVWTTVVDALGYTPVNLAGDTMTGILDMGGFKITSLGSPVSPTDAATKAYVDAAAAGIDVLSPVQAATTATLTATYTNGTTDANGGLGIGATLTNSGTQAALVIDGYTTSVNDRILVKNQTSLLQNGIYLVTNIGSSSTNWVLTRATDYDDSTADQVKPGNYVLVENGTVNANSGWIQTEPATIIIGTDDIVFTQFSASASYTAGTGLALTGSQFSNTGVLSLTTSSGLSTNVSATGNVTVTNTGVTSIVAGNGINVSAATGAVTISTASSTVEVSTTYTVLNTDYTVFANGASAGFTVTLPTSPVAGQVHNIKKIDETRSTITIDGNGNLIDKYTTAIINVPFVSLAIQWNSTSSKWQII